MTKIINSCCYDCEHSVRRKDRDILNAAILYISWICKFNDKANQQKCDKFEEAEEIIEDRIENKDW